MAETKQTPLVNPAVKAKRAGPSLDLLLTGISLLMIAPFVWMALTGFKSLSESADPEWMPGMLRWRNYPEVFKVIPFLRFMAR